MSCEAKKKKTSNHHGQEEEQAQGTEAGARAARGGGSFGATALLAPVLFFALAGRSGASGPRPERKAEQEGPRRRRLSQPFSPKRKRVWRYEDPVSGSDPVPSYKSSDLALRVFSKPCFYDHELLETPGSAEYYETKTSSPRRSDGRSWR
jgi:hypothetical protein